MVVVGVACVPPISNPSSPSSWSPKPLISSSLHSPPPVSSPSPPQVPVRWNDFLPMVHFFLRILKEMVFVPWREWHLLKKERKILLVYERNVCVMIKYFIPVTIPSFSLTRWLIERRGGGGGWEEEKRSNKGDRKEVRGTQVRCPFPHTFNWGLRLNGNKLNITILEVSKRSKSHIVYTYL